MAFVFGDRGVLRRGDIWRAGPVMTLILAGVALAALLVTSLVGLEPEGLARKAANLALVGLPPGVWWLVYYRPAQRQGHILPHLPALIVLGGLLASGVALPVIHRVFQVDRWLVTAPGLTRILGYTAIVGFLQEYLKFAAVRYTVFPDLFRERGDGVAYGVAVGLGFSVVLSLDFFTGGGSAPLAPAAMRVVGTALSQMAFGAVNGYFLAVARFARQGAPVWWFALGLAVTALLNGLYIALRGGIIVSRFGIERTANTPLLGLGVVVALALGTFFVLAFLSRQAEARDAASPGMVVYR